MKGASKLGLRAIPGLGWGLAALDMTTGVLGSFGKETEEEGRYRQASEALAKAQESDSRATLEQNSGAASESSDEGNYARSVMIGWMDSTDSTI